jgi:hypothetical protein
MATTVQQEEGSGDFFTFAAAASAILAERAGVRYSEISRSIHPGFDAPRHAFDGGVEPGAFVSGIIADEGFRELGGDRSPDDVRAYNLAQAALAEFVFETPGWHRSENGTYFFPAGDRTMTIRPVGNSAEGRVGFGVEVWDGSIGEVDFQAESVVRFASFDIREPVNQAREHIQSISDFRL